MITDKHKAFAQAVVALARAHNMNNLNMTFVESHRVEGRSHEQITMTWSEERHDIKGYIELNTRASERIEEEAVKKVEVPRVHTINDWLYNSHLFVVRRPNDGVWFEAGSSDVPQDRQRMSISYERPIIFFASEEQYQRDKDERNARIKLTPKSESGHHTTREVAVSYVVQRS